VRSSRLDFKKWPQEPFRVQIAEIHLSRKKDYIDDDDYIASGDYIDIKGFSLAAKIVACIERGQVCFGDDSAVPS
jgi:hypothetical protein